MNQESPFSYRTRGGSRPDNKPKVYFTCHPSDFDAYFDKVCNDIFEFQDCVVFYTDNMGGYDSEDIFIDLERMNLFIIPVTNRLLTESNRTMQVDFKFARDRHIPVLPLMMESGLYDEYKKPENFGELQYIKPYDSDKTAIGYEEKLKKYLESILISDEVVERIKKEFDAYIFLSYRKKDRKLAKELMRMIHKLPSCEEVAIWFDEYLTPGESFRENINKMLTDSKLFALLVTPNILELHKDGKPNFVMGNEYPQAVKLGKQIIPVEMTTTDKEQLQESFRDIPPCYKVTPENGLGKDLSDSLSQISVSDNDTPEHLYLIGLAYLKGIDVEIDVDTAIKLISLAAEAEFPEAMDRLFSMYRDGDGISLDYSKMLYWADKLFRYYSRTNGEDDEHTILALLNLSNAYTYVGDYKKALDFLKDCYTKFKQNNRKKDYLTLFLTRELASAYENCGNLEEAMSMKKECLEEMLFYWGEDNPYSIQMCNNYAISLMRSGRYKEAIELHDRCYILSCALKGEEDPRSLLMLGNLAYDYRMAGDIRKAIELLQKVYESDCRILGKDHPQTLKTQNYLSACYYEVNDEKSVGLLEECLDHHIRVLGESHPESISVMGNLGAAYEKFGNHDKALEMLTRSCELSVDRLGKEHPNSLLLLRNLVIMYSADGDYEDEQRILTEIYSSQCETIGEDHPETLSTMSSLAIACKRDGDNAKAISFIIPCYVKLCKVVGSQHPKSQQVMKTMMDIIQKDNSLQVINEAFQYFYSLSAKELGDKHVVTISALKVLAVSFDEIGNLQKGHSLFRKHYQLSCEVFGATGPDTIRSLNNLAVSYGKLGDMENNLKAMESCFSVAVRIFDDNSPYKKSIAKNLMLVYEKTDNDDKAEALQMLLGDCDAVRYGYI